MLRRSFGRFFSSPRRSSAVSIHPSCWRRSTKERSSLTESRSFAGGVPPDLIYTPIDVTSSCPAAPIVRLGFGQSKSSSPSDHANYAMRLGRYILRAPFNGRGRTVSNWRAFYRDGHRLKLCGHAVRRLCPVHHHLADSRDVFTSRSSVLRDVRRRGR